jgi:hypothetical protein
MTLSRSTGDFDWHAKRKINAEKAEIRKRVFITGWRGALFFKGKINCQYQKESAF